MTKGWRDAMRLQCDKVDNRSQIVTSQAGPLHAALPAGKPPPLAIAVAVLAHVGCTGELHFSHLLAQIPWDLINTRKI
jgi:hypothetical protein